MSYFPSRHLKTQKKLDRLKNQHTELLRSQPSSKQNLNDTILSAFIPCNQSKPLNQQDNFQDKHIFASRSHLRSLSASKHNHSIKKRKQTFFMSICSVRDIKQPLKTDIIKIPYNTPLNKIKSQKAKFPLKYQNIKFNHSRRRFSDEKGPNQTKNSLVQMIQRKVSNKMQNKKVKYRPSTAVQTKRPNEVINSYSRSLLTVRRSEETKSAVGPRRYLKRENMQNSQLSLSKNKVKLNKNRQSFTVQPWQSNQ